MNKDVLLEYQLKVLQSEYRRVINNITRLEGLVNSPLISHPEIYVADLHKALDDLVLCNEAMARVKQQINEEEMKDDE